MSTVPGGGGGDGLLRSAGPPIAGWLLDITGVLYDSAAHGDGFAIKGSAEAVARLKKEARVRFLSNASATTRKEQAARLRRLGFEIEETDIITPAPVAEKWARDNGQRAHILVYPDVLPELMSVSAPEKPASDDEKPTCVIMADAEEAFTFDAVNTAFRTLLAMKDPHLVTLGNGRFYQRIDGPCIDVGAYAAALKFATGCRHSIIGKPEKSYFEAGCLALGLPPDQVVMVGDDIVSDVGGAQRAGLRAVQVRTGKWRPEWAKHPDVRPDFIADNLKHVVDTVLDAQQQQQQTV